MWGFFALAAEGVLEAIFSGDLLGSLLGIGLAVCSATGAIVVRREIRNRRRNDPRA
jgi:drug/metabolite transporter (DMT)-like permease